MVDGNTDEVDGIDDDSIYESSARRPRRRRRAAAAEKAAPKEEPKTPDAKETKKSRRSSRRRRRSAKEREKEKKKEKEKVTTTELPRSTRRPRRRPRQGGAREAYLGGAGGEAHADARAARRGRGAREGGDAGTAHGAATGDAYAEGGCGGPWWPAGVRLPAPAMPAAHKEPASGLGPRPRWACPSNVGRPAAAGASRGRAKPGGGGQLRGSQHPPAGLRRPRRDRPGCLRGWAPSTAAARAPALPRRRPALGWAAGAGWAPRRRRRHRRGPTAVVGRSRPGRLALVVPGGAARPTGARPTRRSRWATRSPDV